jgi:hypothetical protein
MLHFAPERSSPKYTDGHYSLGRWWVYGLYLGGSCGAGACWGRCPGYRLTSLRSKLGSGGPHAAISEQYFHCRRGHDR